MTRFRGGTKRRWLRKARVKESDRARVVAGRYELEKLLGQGGMGEVWVANDLTTGGKIALKLLKVDMADSKENVARFEREARIATTLVSPHITRVTDSGVDEEGKPFMALELLQGEDLQQRIKAEKILPISYVVRLAIQVGRGLHVAHTAGLVHRDLKPANIFLAQQNGEEIAKVLDFGIAKGGSLESTEYTTAGAMLGTASYMSPEQIRNAKTVDHRADLWALAVVLFRALTGQFPFEETGFELFLALMQDPIPTPARITTLVPTLPPPLNVFFERSFTRDISQRYPSASAMIVGFCRAAGVTVPADVLHAADAAAPSGPRSGVPSSGSPYSGAPSSGAPFSGAPSSGSSASGSFPAVGAPVSGSFPSSGSSASGSFPAVGAPVSGSFPSSGSSASGSFPAVSAPSSGGAPVGRAPFQSSPFLPELDPDEPDNAATLFLQTGPNAPVAASENYPPPGPAAPPVASTPASSKPRVFTYSLDAARAAADLPGAARPPQPPTPAFQDPGPAKPPRQAALPTQLAPFEPRPGAGRGARAAGLWIILIAVLLALAAGAGVIFLRP